MQSNFVFFLNKIIECSRCPAEAWGGASSLWRCMHIICAVRPFPAILTGAVCWCIPSQWEWDISMLGSSGNSLAEERKLWWFSCGLYQKMLCLRQSIEWDQLTQYIAFLFFFFSLKHYGSITFGLAVHVKHTLWRGKLWCWRAFLAAVFGEVYIPEVEFILGNVNQESIHSCLGSLSSLRKKKCVHRVTDPQSVVEF